MFENTSEMLKQTIKELTELQHEIESKDDPLMNMIRREKEKINAK